MWPAPLTLTRMEQKKPAPDYTKLPQRVLPEERVESQPSADKPAIDGEDQPFDTSTRIMLLYS